MEDINKKPICPKCGRYMEASLSEDYYLCKCGAGIRTTKEESYNLIRQGEQ